VAPRDARILAKVAITVGLSGGPLLMIAGFALAIATAGQSSLADLCFYGGAIAGGLLVFGGVAGLVFIPQRRPTQGPPAARGIPPARNHDP
jgi:hypothetical protein